MSGKYDHKMFKPEQGHIPPPPFAEYERDIFVDKSCNQFTQAFKVRVREIIEVIRERNKYRRIRPVGGCVCPVTLDNEPPYLACKFNGTRIVHVEPGSKAERAGLTAGPNIWMIQGKAMTTAEQIK